ncbi:hypothetical protein HS088_TW07G00482 [Tripterygium wilfordii]|uniref:GIR1-like zinc ribbon domain-containing protein n=1 Tax=Tripterygium wilfordii TaxID=458696 RepID=A0A7J7DF23_TRIWF|nr:uncharacterized protein LOC120002841 [Tripterygium wilfordii]KAF5744901.1 hypothetical protein HS088_TW07G00482 [Tripterygium wilfordii]
MSSGGRGNNSPELDLKLNLSPPLVLNQEIDQSTNEIKASSWRTSPESSCLASEMEDAVNHLSSCPEEASSMVLVGCRRCLIYVMLSEVDPKCPRCQSSVLLHLFNSHENQTNKTRRNPINL